MSNELSIFSNAPVPSHIAAFLNAPENANIEAREALPTLRFKGKVWKIVVDGQEHVINNKDGEPRANVEVIVLNHNNARSRSFYEGEFDDSKPQAPKCFSTDGVLPDASVREPQSATCAQCPQSAKGSKIGQGGRATTACTQFKRLAVVPANAVKDFPALLLRLPQTSLWDKENGENEAKGFYAWDQYLTMLKARGITNTGAVVTKIKFDPRMAYPKLLFSPVRFVEGDELLAVASRWNTPEVTDLLSHKDGDAQAPTAPVAAVAGPQPIATPIPVHAPTPAPVAAPAPAAAPYDDDDDDGGMPPIQIGGITPATVTEPVKVAAPAQAPKPPKAAAAKPAPAKTSVDDGLKSLINNWGGAGE